MVGGDVVPTHAGSMANGDTIAMIDAKRESGEEMWRRTVWFRSMEQKPRPGSGRGLCVVFIQRVMHRDVKAAEAVA